MSVAVPVPTTFDQIIFAAIGWQAGSTIGDKIDEAMKETKFYKSLGGASKLIADSLLAFIHHWMLGALIMIYVTRFGFPAYSIFQTSDIFWFAVGLFAQDAKDIPLKYVAFLGRQTTPEEPPEPAKPVTPPPS